MLDKKPVAPPPPQTFDGGAAVVAAAAEAARNDEAPNRPISTQRATASAAVLNVTAVLPSATGWLTVWDGDGSPPNASNVNYVVGSIVANQVRMHLSKQLSTLSRQWPALRENESDRLAGFLEGLAYAHVGEDYSQPRNGGQKVSLAELPALARRGRGGVGAGSSDGRRRRRRGFPGGRSACERACSL